MRWVSLALLLSGLAAVVLLPPAVPAGPSARPPSGEVVEGDPPGTGVPVLDGVINPGGNRGYVLGPAGQLESIDLTTGRTVWSAGGHWQPLALVGHRLVVLPRTPEADGNVRLLVVDVTQKGKVLVRSEPIRVPGWVTLDRWKHRQHFNASVVVTEAGSFVRWQAYRGYWDPEPDRPDSKWREDDAAGVVRLDLDTGAVTPVPQAEAPFPRREVPPGIRGKVRNDGQFVWAVDPVRVVGGTAFVVEKHQFFGRYYNAILRRWDLATGEELPSQQLDTGTFSVHVMFSTDERFVLTYRNEPFTPADRRRNTWRVWEAGTGAYAGEVPAMWSPTGVTVHGGRAYVAVQNDLSGKTPQDPLRPLGRYWAAVDLSGKRVLWRHTVESPRHEPE